MAENITFLEKMQHGLKQIVLPYLRTLKQKQKKADFIKLCISSAEKDDFLKLDELLNSKMAKEIKADETLKECVTHFKSLGKYASQKVEQYRIKLIEDLTQICEESNLEIQIDFPKFTALKGINGEIDFSTRCTTINKKVLKSIDPRRIFTVVSRLKHQLYDRPYDPQKFIDSLYQVYVSMAKNKKSNFTDSVSIQKFYLEYVLSLQTKAFFQNMDKGKFKGYSLDQFSVDLWCYFNADISGTSEGYELQLSPGRNKSLWLMDTQGELRQITGISFHKQ